MASFFMRFFRNGKIYRFDEGATLPDRVPAFKRMSFHLAIPCQAAMSQRPPPIHQPAQTVKEAAFAVQFNCRERRMVF